MNKDIESQQEIVDGQQADSIIGARSKAGKKTRQPRTRTKIQDFELAAKLEQLVKDRC